MINESQNIDLDWRYGNPTNSPAPTLMHWRWEASVDIPSMTIGATFEPLCNPNSLIHNDVVINESEDQPVELEDDPSRRLRGLSSLSNLLCQRTFSWRAQGCDS